jgi:hypothetical protein
MEAGRATTGRSALCPVSVLWLLRGPPASIGSANVGFTAGGTHSSELHQSVAKSGKLTFDQRYAVPPAHRGY